MEGISKKIYLDINAPTENGGYGGGSSGHSTYRYQTLSFCMGKACGKFASAFLTIGRHDFVFPPEFLKTLQWSPECVCGGQNRFVR